MERMIRYAHKRAIINMPSRSFFSLFIFSFVLVQVTDLELVDAAEVIIVPVVNPDGYVVRRIGIYHEYA